MNNTVSKNSSYPLILIVFSLILLAFGLSTSYANCKKYPVVPSKQTRVSGGLCWKAGKKSQCNNHYQITPDKCHLTCINGNKDVYITKICYWGSDNKCHTTTAKALEEFCY